MNLPWLESQTETWRSSADQGRQAHAVMISGARGTGKRVLAAWMIKRHLGIGTEDAPPQFPVEVPEHADVRWIRPPEDKFTIGIEQIRSLVGELNLTSFVGAGKAAVIEPANSMTTNAANSLLKTLEEPPGNALIVLVTDRLGQLPATIMSRCQRLNVHVPSEQVGLDWLHAREPGVEWHRVLADSGLAPLAAMQAQGRLDETDALAADFVAVAEGRTPPLPVASRWAKHEPDFVLGWLGRQIQSCIMRSIGGRSSVDSTAISDSVLRRVDRRNLFCYLDIINRLRSQPVGSFNMQLTLECLLIDWAGNLRSVMQAE